MSYTKEDVFNSYFKDGNIDPHRKNTIQIVKALLIEKGEFHIDDFHKRISESRGAPITSNYTTLLTAMVEGNFLKKDHKTKIYSATNLLKVFMGVS
jgi:hypothetical protein